MSLPFLLFLIACLMLVSAWLLQPWWTRRRRARLRETPFPASWRRILQHRVPLLQRLPPDLQMQLKRHIQVFLAEKPFIGCGGLAIDDDIRVTVAAQACLPLLNRPDAYYPELRQILVYPGPFVVDRSHTDGIGVLQNMRQVLAGESWSQGQVILSWQDVVADAAHPEAGRNVVIHEFAHQLDQETGAANGAPELGSAQAYARWSQVLGTEPNRGPQACWTLTAPAAPPSSSPWRPRRSSCSQGPWPPITPCCSRSCAASTASTLSAGRKERRGAHRPPRPMERVMTSFMISLVPP